MSKTLKRRTNSKKRLVKRNKKHTNMRKTKNVKRRGGATSAFTGDCNGVTCYTDEQGNKIPHNHGLTGFTQCSNIVNGVRCPCKGGVLPGHY